MRRALVIEALLFLMVARLALIFVPFPRIARGLGGFMAPDQARMIQSRTSVAPGTATAAREIGWAVTRSAHWVPFRAVCLPQAIAARIMLKRRRIVSVMHFGAAKGDEKLLDTHAWLDAAGIEVTGYPVSERFAEIGCFV